MGERQLLVVGLMSGTSADGIDAAVVRVPEVPDLAGARQAVHHHYAYTAAQRRMIHGLFDTPQATADVLCRANFLLGEWFAAAALEAIARAGASPAEVDLIGLHGQTVYHCPPAAASRFQPAGASTVDDAANPVWRQDEMGDVACTLQLGEPAVIVERSGVTTVADFRVRDVAAGGQGAPLVSYVDALLFTDRRALRAVLNLGGIANVTILLPSGAGPAGTHRSLAFDTGPGNMVLDWLAHRLTGGELCYDVGGHLASRGSLDDDLLAVLLDDPYFAAPPPKTTGRERFGAPYAERVLGLATARGLSIEDTLATATALTAETIARGIVAAVEHSFPTASDVPPEIIAGGGGTANSALMAEIARRLPHATLTTHEAFGIGNQAKEALSFALLAAAAVRGQPNTLPSCTGASHSVVMGKIVPGANYTSLMRTLFG
ncbi:MAG: anhydro-N-acetylmuramic acid kinase [Chloroflexi bacterium]|nr:anhydro-N-acetylmuramic acid kinase [Chloroflexota bacterium]